VYREIFPGLFRPLAAVPPDLAAHFRYPQDLFAVQAQVYSTFHMKDPRVFYNREDLWAFPNELFTGAAQPLEPYYVNLKLDPARGEEFALILPFTPAGKDNMVAWMAGRSDAPNYGRLLVYRFPKDRTVFGPMQIEARINQDTSISSQLALWNQQGSKVIRGNLLVVPVADALLYVEPLYLQASGSALPELKRVIVAYGTRIAMEPTLEAALARIFVGLPVGAVCRHALVKWTSAGSDALLEVGPEWVRRLGEPLSRAEAAGTDEARLAAYEELRGLLGWLAAGLDDGPFGGAGGEG